LHLTSELLRSSSYSRTAIIFVSVDFAPRSEKSTSIKRGLDIYWYMAWNVVNYAQQRKEIVDAAVKWGYNASDVEKFLDACSIAKVDMQKAKDFLFQASKLYEAKFGNIAQRAVRSEGLISASIFLNKDFEDIANNPQLQKTNVGMFLAKTYKLAGAVSATNILAQTKILSTLGFQYASIPAKSVKVLWEVGRKKKLEEIPHVKPADADFARVQKKISEANKYAETVKEYEDYLKGKLK